jgi:predicted RecB family nuclease
MKIVSGTIELAATDLSNHLGCAHMTELNRALALKQRAKPTGFDPSLAILAERGEEHEKAYIQYLQNKGLSIINLDGKSPEATIEAMQQGIEVIVQAGVSLEGWNGKADILLKVTTPSKLGAWSYEVQDTKLAKNTRAGTILQLSLYTELIGILQGVMPQQMHIVKPGDPFETESFRFNDFQAYYRYVKNSLMTVIANAPEPSYPEPVPQCDACKWWKDCDAQRHADDHLSLIANIRSLHIGELQKKDIQTLEQFAKRDIPFPGKPEYGNLDTYHTIHSQAKIQWEGRIQKKPLYKLTSPAEGRGFARLPEPNPGDVYFDIEGDPFYDQGGLEYLLGVVFRDEKVTTAYRSFWATDRTTEKKAFEQFIDFIMERWKKFPGMNIYHYGIYEPGAIKRLTGRHATRADEVDSLLRGKRFIDIHAVIREGVKASVEHYKLKDLEAFTSYQRKVELSLASASRRAVESALELKEVSSLSDQTTQFVQDYNEDDCRATASLHQWLEELRKELITAGHEIRRPELLTGEAKENLQEVQTRARVLYNGLTEGLPEDRDAFTDEQKAKWLLANMIDYFRREFNSSCWEYFRVHELDSEDLMEERKAIAGLEFVGEIPQPGKKKLLPVHRYKFPPQEVGLEIEDKLDIVMGGKFGTVYAISPEECTVDIKKTKETVDVHPYAVHENDLVGSDVLAKGLFDLAQNILEDGMKDVTYRAAKHLLLKMRPQLKDGAPLTITNENNIVDDAVRIVSELERGVLAIQGPPGSGKTYTGSMMILKLASQGKRIGVTAPSHKVIRNLFDKVLELGNDKNININLVHKPKKESDELPPGLEEVMEGKQALAALDKGKVVGGTAWLWASNEARETLDYLFVDEAGQMSLAYVLAAGRSAKNIVLLGDPQQLEQPQKGAHPEGADIAALTHLLDGMKTMPNDKGLFINLTRRLHPSISQYTSEVFYEGRLHSLPGLEKQVIEGTRAFKGAGLFYVPVNHSGCQNKSKVEIETIIRIVKNLTAPGVLWTNEKGEKHTLTSDDIVIVAPYNAQVAALSESLPGHRIGTVDKFQGQEAAVVIYSMTSSSAEDAPRGMSFLYNPNRLNVATSRAQSVCILVASEKLMEVDCRTVDQVKWANALCRFRELASVVRSLT